MGFYTIKYTDGNIMPIIDQLIQTKPDALHSLDLLMIKILGRLWKL